LSVNGAFGQTDGVSFRRVVLRKIQFVPESNLFPTAASGPMDADEPAVFCACSLSVWMEGVSEFFLQTFQVDNLRAFT
jgi:hypothetical protein